MITLSTLEKSSWLKDKARRLGRGNASKGNYAWKGLKGQKARAWKWSKIPAYFEGGQTPLYMRLPKRKGFKRFYKLTEEIAIINLWAIDKKYNNGDIVSKQSLFEKGLIKSPNLRVKILGNGSTSKSFVYEGIDLFSEKAKSAQGAPKTRKAAKTEESIDSSDEASIESSAE